VDDDKDDEHDSSQSEGGNKEGNQVNQSEWEVDCVDHFCKRAWVVVFDWLGPFRKFLFQKFPHTPCLNIMRRYPFLALAVHPPILLLWFCENYTMQSGLKPILTGLNLVETGTNLGPVRTSPWTDNGPGWPVSTGLVYS
jgi:hypothetical protein